MILKRSALLLMLILLPTAVFAAKRYVVKKGDNLGNFAKRFRVSIQSIKKTNGLNTDRLNVGKTLIIPDAINNQTNVIASKDSEKNENELEVNKTNLQSFSLRYIVKKEDTLSGIANRFGISVEKISYVNGLTENGLKTGMILTIPDSRNKDLGNMIFSPTAQVGVEPKLVSSDGHREYIVKDGDSLTSIAEGCGVSVSDLKNANGLSSEEVRIGTKLIIPNSQIPMRVVRVSPNENEINKYVVKKGDTLSKIASRYRVSVKDLKNVNGMKSDKVKFGMSLIIPNSTLSRNVEPKTPVISDNNKYIVQKGDNISSISRRYGVSQAELKRANNIKGDTIKSGQLLRVPSKINGKNELVVEDIKVEDNDTHINSLPEIETAKAIQSNDSSTYENGLTRDVIISIAKRFLGAPYKFGGDSLIRGLDCSAFVNKVFT